MRKLFLMLLVLPLVFVSCSIDDKDINRTITLKESDKSLVSGSTYQIVASSYGKVTYISENEYNATVSETGLVKAMRVGGTTVVLTNGANTQRFSVKVQAQSNLYPEPNREWGISRTDLINKLGKPFTQTKEGIIYSEYSASAPRVIYMFDSNNKLTSSTVMLKTAHQNELGTFLTERYVVEPSIIATGFTLVFTNSLKLDDVTMLVGAKLHDKDFWLIMYSPYTKTNSAKSSVSDDDVATMQAVDKLVEALN